MIQPPGQTSEHAEAKRLYVSYMEATGFYSKQALPLHARYFAEDMRDQERSLREHVADVKQDLKDAKAAIVECKAEVKSAVDEKERKWAEQSLARAKTTYSEIEVSLANATLELEAFKNDKRPYLIEYVNREVFGDGASQAQPLIRGDLQQRAAPRGQGWLRSFCLARAWRPAVGGASIRTLGRKAGALC
jgi:hypothetical protein